MMRQKTISIRYFESGTTIVKIINQSSPFVNTKQKSEIKTREHEYLDKKKESIYTILTKKERFRRNLREA